MNSTSNFYIFSHNLLHFHIIFFGWNHLFRVSAVYFSFRHEVLLVDIDS